MRSFLLVCIFIAQSFLALAQQGTLGFNIGVNYLSPFKLQKEFRRYDQPAGSGLHFGFGYQLYDPGFISGAMKAEFTLFNEVSTPISIAGEQNFWFGPTDTLNTQIASGGWSALFGWDYMANIGRREFLYGVFGWKFGYTRYRSRIAGLDEAIENGFEPEDWYIYRLARRPSRGSFSVSVFAGGQYEFEFFDVYLKTGVLFNISESETTPQFWNTQVGLRFPINRQQTVDP